MPEDEHEATKARTASDVAIDGTFEAIVAPALVAGASWLADAHTPGAGLAVSGPATMLVMRGTAWLKRLGMAFYETFEAEAQARGRDSSAVLCDVSEGGAAAILDAYRRLQEAVDPRAAPALARLVADVTMGGATRDAFFRDMGTLFANADATEWDALEVLGPLLAKGVNSASIAANGAPPIDITHVRIEDRETSRAPGVATRVLVATLIPSPGFGPATHTGEPAPPSWDRLARLMQRTGALPADGAGAGGGDRSKRFTFELDVATRLARILEPHPIGPTPT